MTDEKSKKPTNNKVAQDETAKVEPVLYASVANTEDEEIDLAKAYDWTKKYSYDPAGRTYIRSEPFEGVIEPKDEAPRD